MADAFRAKEKRYKLRKDVKRQALDPEQFSDVIDFDKWATCARLPSACTAADACAMLCSVFGSLRASSPARRTRASGCRGTCICSDGRGTCTRWKAMTAST